MEQVIGREVLHVLILGQIVGDVGINNDRGLIGPASGDIANGIAAAANDQERQFELLDKAHALAMGLNREVEATEAVAAEGVGAALEDNGRGAECVNGGLHDGLEKVDVGNIINTVTERDVDRVIFAQGGANLIHVACAREKVAIVLVEGHSHNAICGVKGFLDAVAMVDVDVDVQDTGIVSDGKVVVWSLTFGQT
ncbi:hypothetical protein BC938DRAFT_473769 [Jimgerdemannia flammicorona]|uniref:Uncharacterized protein n=1 Tax=Jimgerdemannia flammicorona TaxID=994334 RepID=A0A433QT22_9FUNG|nr:hypothetical protein BC938DRAFT_473769 [Jimgerdemannia flammicorona]